MARQRRKKEGLQDRFARWARANQRVLIVVLLGIVSVTFGASGLFDKSFSPTPGGQLADVVFGREITLQKLTTLRNRVEAVRPLCVEYLGSRSDLPFSQDPRELAVYLASARRLGLRVSDDELGAARRTIWRQFRSARRARTALEAEGKMPNFGDPALNRQYQQELFLRRTEILQEMETMNEFDRQDWGKLIVEVQGRGQISVRAFEETLRDLILIAHLDEYVQSTVHVSEEEVYERYRRDDERRKLSWVKLEATDDLRERVKKKITEKEVEAHYAADKEGFRKEVMLRFEYLLVSAEHFETEVRKEITDEDVEKAYEEELHRHLRPTIRSDDGVFQLLSAEEMEAEKKELYEPLEEVREEVFEKLVKTRTTDKLTEFGNGLTGRLYPVPAKKDDEQEGKEPIPATFEEMAGEYEFVIAGSTPFAEEADAEEVFAPAYNAALMPGWFVTVKSRGRLSDFQQKAFSTFQLLYEDEEEKESGSDGSGTRKPRALVFYANVVTRPSQIPEFEDIRDEVREDLVEDRVLDLLTDAAEKEAEAVNSGAKAFAALAGREIEVALEDTGTTRTDSETETVSEGQAGSGTESKSAAEAKAEAETALARFLEIETSPQPLRRWRSFDGSWSYEQIRFPKEEEEQDPNATVPALEDPHPASQTLVAEAFSIKEKRQAAVALQTPEQTDVEDGDDHACYLVSLVDIVPPDPGGFATRRDFVTRTLLGERRLIHRDQWKDRLLRKASQYFGQALVIGEEEASGM